jgi:hypothetical protein
LAVAALWALQTWRRELRGGTNYRAARNVLASVYAVESAIDQARATLARIAELEFQGAAVAGQVPEVAKLDWSQPAHEFMKQVLSAQEKLSTAYQEARISWGDDARGSLEPLFDFIGLFTLAYVACWSMTSWPADLLLTQKRSYTSGQASILYAAETDPYAEQLRGAVRTAEKFYRKFL